MPKFRVLHIVQSSIVERVLRVIEAMTFQDAVTYYDDVAREYGFDTRHERQTLAGHYWTNEQDESLLLIPVWRTLRKRG